MFDKIRELLWPALQVFIVGAAFCWYPPLGIFGLVGLLVLSIIKAPKVAAEKGYKFIAGLLLSFVWVVFAQTICGWLFGVSLDSFLHEYGNLKGLFGGVVSKSDALSKIFIQEMLILIVSFGSLYLHLTSKTQKKTIWVAVISGLLLLSYYWVDNYAKVSEDVSDNQRYALTELRSAFHVRFITFIKSWTLGVNRNSNWEQLKIEQPFKRYVVQAKTMKLDSGEDFVLRPGSILYFKDEPKSEIHGSNIVPWYETTCFDDVSGKEYHGKVTIENLSSEPPEQPKRIEIVQTPSPVPMEDPKILVVKKGQGWVRTGLVPNINSVIYYEVISPSDCTVESLLTRVGDGNIANLSPHDGNDKLAMAILALHNPLGYECEVKLSSTLYSEVIVRVAMKNKGGL